MSPRALYVFNHLTEGWVPAGRLMLTPEREVVASNFAYGTRYMAAKVRAAIGQVLRNSP